MVAFFAPLTSYRYSHASSSYDFQFSHNSKRVMPRRYAKRCSAKHAVWLLTLSNQFGIFKEPLGDSFRRRVFGSKCKINRQTHEPNVKEPKTEYSQFNLGCHDKMGCPELLVILFNPSSPVTPVYFLSYSFRVVRVFGGLPLLLIFALHSLLLCGFFTSSKRKILDMATQTLEQEGAAVAQMLESDALLLPAKHGITLTINGSVKRLEVAPWTTLLDLLREHLEPDRHQKRLRSWAVRRVYRSASTAGASIRA